MLVLEGTAKERGFQSTVGEYKPLLLKFERLTPGDDFYYWECGDQEHLLEVKISPGNGELLEVDLVHVPGSSIIRRENKEALEQAEGFPLFETKLWKEKIGPKENVPYENLFLHNRALNFDFEIGAESVSIKIKNGAPFKLLRNRTLDFLFTKEDVFCGLVLRDSQAAKLAAKLWIS